MHVIELKLEMRKQTTVALALGALLALAGLLAYARHADAFQLAAGPPPRQERPEPTEHGNNSLPAASRAREAEVGREISEELRKIWDADAVLRALTRRRPGELPALTASFNEEDEQHLQASENIFYKLSELSGQHRISDVGLMGLVARSQSVVYSDMYTQRYDSFHDLKLAAGPAVDQEQCLGQLERLLERAELQEQLGYNSTDLNLFQLLDTWARMSSGVMLGNVYMAGLYDECLRLRIADQAAAGGARLATRYCVVSIKHRDWPKIDKHDIASLKAGVCLPKSCDSASYKNKHELVMRLLKTNQRPSERNGMKFHSLFCLPDEDSPLRSVWRSPQAVATLACLTIWLALLAFCTYKHHQLRPLYERLGNAAGAAKSFGLTNMNGHAGGGASSGAPAAGGAQFRLYKMLSITNNLATLFDTTKSSALMQLENGAAKPLEGDATNQTAAGRLEGGKIVDLSCIEGIKVVAMVYVIMGHVLMCMTTLMENGREMATNGSAAFFMANLVPAFAVNSFFTITGLLTSYLMFQQNQSRAFIASPSKWAAFVVYRYLRIMPMYALAVLYCKTLAKYTNSGPLWDYATSALGQRRACELEPWRRTLLFQSNFRAPLEHCIPGGWYLANDFQFFLVTPLYLALLYKRPQLGRLALYASILAGYLLGLHSILSAPVADLRPIARFAPHGFKTYVSHFSFNYTQPQYRIPAYLIGLLVGHKLFYHERARRAYRRALLATGGDLGDQSGQEPDWSPRFKRLAMPASLALVCLCCATPLLGSLLPFNKPAARFMVALITPSYHVLFATAVGLYVLLATTRQGSRRLNALLSASCWKPLARVSLCALLVNVEVINYIVQGSSSLHYVTGQFHAALNCICILATYAVSILVCVLFEAPIRAALNAALTYAISRATKAAATTQQQASRAPAAERGEKEKLM